jgi:hypothetical protein
VEFGIDYSKEGAVAFFTALNQARPDHQDRLLRGVEKFAYWPFNADEWAAPMVAMCDKPLLAKILSTFPYLRHSEIGITNPLIRPLWFKVQGHRERLFFLYGEIWPHLSKQEIRAIFRSLGNDIELMRMCCELHAPAKVLLKHMLPKALQRNAWECEQLCTWHSLGFWVSVTLDAVQFQFTVRLKGKESINFAWPRDIHLHLRDHSLTDETHNFGLRLESESVAELKRSALKWGGDGMLLIIHHLLRLTAGLPEFSDLATALAVLNAKCLVSFPIHYPLATILTNAKLASVIIRAAL